MELKIKKKLVVIGAVPSRAKHWDTFAQQTSMPAPCRHRSLWSLRTWSLGTLRHATGCLALRGRHRVSSTACARTSACTHRSELHCPSALGDKLSESSAQVGTAPKPPPCTPLWLWHPAPWGQQTSAGASLTLSCLPAQPLSKTPSGGCEMQHSRRQSVWGVYVWVDAHPCPVRNAHPPPAATSPGKHALEQPVLPQHASHVPAAPQHGVPCHGCSGFLKVPAPFPADPSFSPLLLLLQGNSGFLGTVRMGGSSLLLPLSAGSPQPAHAGYSRCSPCPGGAVEDAERGRSSRCPPAAFSVLPAQAAPGPGGWAASLGSIQQKQLVMFLLLPGVGCSFLSHKTMPSFKNKEIIKYI